MPGWGSWTLWGLAAYQQGSDALAKQSTRYVATGAAIASCNVDRSQRDVDLGVGAGSVVLLEASPASARFDISHPRTLGFRVTANNTDTGTLFRHGAASPTRLVFSAANTISAVNNNSVVGTITVPGLTGVRKAVVVAWTSEANVDTSGAADAVASTLHVWNVTDGTYERSRFTHAAATTKTQTAFFGAADNASTLVYSGAITGIWFENRMQSPDEVAADWATSYIPPTSELDTSFEHEGLPATTSTAIHGRDNLHGPAAAHAADKTRRMQKRTTSALWNDRMRTRPLWTSSLLTASDPKIRNAPGDSRYRMHLAWLRSYPVPDTASHIWVRVHLRTFVTSGDAVPLGVRLYSLSGINKLGEEPAEYHLGEEVVERDDAGLGEWCISAVIPVNRSARGYTYLALALAVDPEGASANDAAERITVRAVNVVPCVKAQQGGLPFAP